MKAKPDSNSMDTINDHLRGQDSFSPPAQPDPTEMSRKLRQVCEYNQ